MLPPHQLDGNLPAGVHRTTWPEFADRFSSNTHRARLLAGLHQAALLLKLGGCSELFVDGSYVSTKEIPNDFDAAWSMTGVDLVLLKRLEPVFFDFAFGRAAQKAKYLGEFFPGEMQEGNSGKPFLSFFQIDKATGSPKGVVCIDLRTLHDQE